MEFTTYYLALLALAGVLIARNILAWWRRRSMIRRHGCQPIVEFPRSGFWRSDYSKELEKAIQDGRFNASASAEFEKAGSSTFIRTTWDERMIHSMEPQNHQALVTNMDDWIKEPRPAVRLFVGDNIVLQNGSAWRRSRDLVNPLFMRTELNDTQHFRVFVDRMIALIPRDGSTIDMQPLIRKLVSLAREKGWLKADIVQVHRQRHRVHLWQSVDSLRDSSGKSDEFISAYDRATIGAGKRSRPTGFLTNLYLMVKPDKAWLADCKTVHDFIDSCIASYRTGAAEKRTRYVLIDGMSAAFPDPIELRYQLLSVFSLARETPSVLASNTLFLLARNPAIWTELRSQALALGDKNTMTFDQLMSLSLFRNTVLETLRLHSPITRIRRMAARDTFLPKGGGPSGSSPAFIPKNSIVWIHKYPSSRDPKIWGEDVESFRPSRFEGRTLGWEFSPFSSGPRRCPANRQVVAQCIYMLYRLVMEFEAIENRDPCERYVEGVMMCIYGKNGSLVGLRPAGRA